MLEAVSFGGERRKIKPSQFEGFRASAGAWRVRGASRREKAATRGQKGRRFIGEPKWRIRETTRFRARSRRRRSRGRRDDKAGVASYRVRSNNPANRGIAAFMATRAGSMRRQSAASNAEICERPLAILGPYHVSIFPSTRWMRSSRAAGMSRE